MKLFKKMFGTKPKQISKYESNTLADLNESPDRRKAEDEQLEVTASTASVPRKKNNTKASEKVATSTKKQTPAKATQREAKGSNASADKTVTSGNTNAAEKKKAITKATGKEAEKKAAKPTVKKATRTVPAPNKEKTENTDKVSKSKSELSNIDNKKEIPQSEIAISEPVNIAAEGDSNASVENAKPIRNGRFEIKKSKDGRFVFNLYASNSVIVATSQIYSSSTAAMNGIKSVIANASTAQIEDQTLKSVTTASFPKWEIYRDKSEHYRFRLCASNGSCVCHSQGYTSKTNCKKGIESIIKFAAGAEITKAYLNKDK